MHHRSRPIARVQADAAAAEAYYREFQTLSDCYSLLGEGPMGADESHSVAASIGEGFLGASSVTFASQPTALSQSPISRTNPTSDAVATGTAGPVEQYFAVTSEEQGDGDADSLVPQLWLLA